MALKLTSASVKDTDVAVPRAGRAGLVIPDVLMKAVEDSWENDVTKELVVGVDDVKELDALFRSIQGRHGYVIARGTNDGPKAGTKQVLFKVTDRRDPEEIKRERREKRANVAADEEVE